MEFELVTNSAEQTIELGRRIGSKLAGGEIIALCGPLGSGKTRLVKGIAEGASSGDQNQINSPTFVIVNEYIGRLEIYHIDAYRIESLSEFEMLGFDDFCHPGSAVLIEWADRIEPALKTLECIRIELAHTGINARKIHIKNAPFNIDLPL